jgi:hypothetical protein
MDYRDDELKKMLGVIDINQRFEEEQYRRRLEDKLYRMYEELRYLSYRWVFKQRSFRGVNLELFPKDMVEVVEHIASHAEIDTTSVLLALLGSISASLCV